MARHTCFCTAATGAAAAGAATASTSSCRRSSRGHDCRADNCRADDCLAHDCLADNCLANDGRSNGCDHWRSDNRLAIERAHGESNERAYCSCNDDCADIGAEHERAHQHSYRGANSRDPQRGLWLLDRLRR